MIAALLLAFASDSATLCVRDARSGRPVEGVEAVDSSGTPTTLPNVCNRIATGSWVIRRVGYEPKRVHLRRAGAPVIVRLDPSSPAATLIDTANVYATRDLAGTGVESGVARTTESIDVGAARRMGLYSVTGLVAALPYGAPRAARGESGLSLRGSRREGTVVMLDGVPLNDPSTGIADISDLPLVLLGGATVSLGSDPMGAGSGATGGVLALHSAAQRALSLQAGSFGQVSAEGAYHAVLRQRLVSVSTSYRQSRNDFAFENDAGAAANGASVRERRVNNDERRGGLTLGIYGNRARSLVVMSSGERGMVGAANVRAYDADRSRTTRVLLRTQAMFGPLSIVAGARALSLAYRDPARPELDATSRAGAADIEARGIGRRVAWRLGGGADHVTGTGGLEQSRGRGFGAISSTATRGRTALQLGARVDAAGSLGVLPSFSAELRHGLIETPPRSLSVGARVAQATRVPTLYDLYFSSPQRLFVRTLDPERVTLDAETNVSWREGTRAGMLELHGGLVARDTRDAIIWFPGNFGWSPANVGAERLRGAEGRIALSAGWGALSAWTTAYDTELRTGELRIPTPYVARVAGGASLLGNLGATSATALVRTNGRRPFTAGSRNRDFELPAVTLIDLSIARRTSVFHSSALVAFSVENATDVAWQSVRGFPSPGRSLAVTVTFTPSSSP
jgi:outer membrane cobalamin receptor